MSPDEARSRFELVSQDQRTAFDGLKRVLAYLDETKPEAELRVIICNNLVVGLTARIEEAIREYFNEYLMIAQDSPFSFIELTPSLKKAAFKSSVQTLKRFDNPEDCLETLRALNECMNGNNRFTFEVDFILDNQGNMRSSQVTEIAKRFGISEIWKRVAASQNVTDYYEDPEVDRVTTRLLQDWNAIFEERDKVVHRISQADGWESELIATKIDYVLGVVDELGNVISTECQVWLQTATERARHKLG